MQLVEKFRLTSKYLSIGNLSAENCSPAFWHWNLMLLWTVSTSILPEITLDFLKTLLFILDIPDETQCTFVTLINPCIEEMLIVCLFVRKGDWDTEQLRKMPTAIHHWSSRAALKLQLTYWMNLWLESYPWNCPTILHPWKNITAGMWVAISDLVFSSQRNCWKLSFTYIQAWLCPTWPHSCVSQEECGGFLIKRAQD